MIECCQSANDCLKPLRRAFETANNETTFNSTLFSSNLPHSRESSTIPDPPESNRFGLKVNSGSKHNQDGALAEKNEAQPVRKKRRIDAENDVHIGYYADFPTVPMFARLNVADMPTIYVRKDKSPSWTVEQWKSNFPPDGSASIEKVVFLEEFAKKYDEDIQTARKDQKRKFLRQHLREHIKGTLMPLPPASRSGSEVPREIKVGRHIQLDAISETAIKFEEIQLAEAYEFGDIEATKKKLKALLSQPTNSVLETSLVSIPGPKLPRSSSVLGHEEEAVFTGSMKGFENSITTLQTALADHCRNLANFRKQFTTDKAIVKEREDAVKVQHQLLQERETSLQTREDDYEERKNALDSEKKLLEEKSSSLIAKEDALAEREKVLLQKENFQTCAGNTIGSLQRLEADLNYRDEVLKYKEENWVKDLNDSFKLRQQDLLEREADIAKSELEVNSSVDKRQVASFLPASLPYPAAMLGSLDIPQGLTFEDVFGKLDNNQPNGGMFRGKNPRNKVFTDVPLSGISFNEIRVLSDVFVRGIEIDGQPMNQKLATKEGETYSIYSKDGVRKLVKDLDQGSFIEFKGKWYICRTLLKEQVEDEAF